MHCLSSGLSYMLLHAQGTALRICLLLLDVALHSHNAARSAVSLIYVELDANYFKMVEMASLCYCCKFLRRINNKFCYMLEESLILAKGIETKEISN